MTYAPKHLSARPRQFDTARLGLAAARGGRSVVALGTAVAATGTALTASALAAEGTSNGSSDGVATKRATLSFGARGTDVAALQSRLGVAGDGVFGPVTAAAVKTFQRTHGLVVDGIVGSRTWAALERPAGPTADAASAATSDTAATMLSFGSRGPLVRALQAKVGVVADGIFGRDTLAAVKMFQRTHRLVVDGIVGPRTSAALAKAPVAPGGTSTKPTPASTPTPSATPATPAVVAPGAMYELPFPAGAAYYITQGPFGATSHYKFKDRHHVDFGLPTGSAVVSSADGVVYQQKYDPMGGNTMLIQDASGDCMEYAHLSSFTVQPGQRVAQGQLVARSGATGAGITGPHLHWGIVDCRSYTSIRVAESKELGTSYVPGVLAYSRNGL